MKRTILKVGGKPVQEFRLVAFGPVEVEDPVAGGPFTFTPEHAQQAVAWFARLGRELAIDYDHQITKGFSGPGIVAAGWVGGVEARPDGLYCTRVEWTPRAAELIAAGEYRYFSPVIYWSGGYGQQLAALGPVAISNDPAMHHVPALAASRVKATELSALLSNFPDARAAGDSAALQGSGRMDAIAKVLGLGPDATVEQILAAVDQSNVARVAPLCGLPATAPVEEVKRMIQDKSQAGGKPGADAGAGGGNTANTGHATTYSRLAGRLKLGDGIADEDAFVAAIERQQSEQRKGAVSPEEHRAVLGRVGELEKRLADSEYDTFCASGAGKGRITPAMKPQLRSMFTSDRKGFEALVATLPVQMGEGSDFKGDASGNGPAPETREAMIAGGRKSFADECAKKTVLCSEKAWVNDVLRQKQLAPLTTDEITKNAIKTAE